MGGLNLYKGIIVFDSKEVGRYLKFSNNDYPLRTLRNYQEGILCNFCRRDNISNENKKIIGINYCIADIDINVSLF